ncbi:hypothetical protein BKA83DRAFT_4123350 [Pisolithus microcarpus]|nr:hypothetical protein BKA83DRAFT_4123350 [Pisolithus microcarpus]
MPRSDRFSLAKTSRSKWIPYDIRSRSRYVSAGQLAVLQTSHLHDPTIVTGVTTSTGADHDIDVDSDSKPSWMPGTSRPRSWFNMRIVGVLPDADRDLQRTSISFLEGAASSNGGGADSSSSD